MADFKIENYVDVDSIDGTELVLVSKSGAYRKTTIEEIRNLATDITNTALADLVGKIASAQDVKNILNTINTNLENHSDSIASINTQLSDIAINVKSFKCDDGEYVKGDGIHDDTTGIQRAIDTLFPFTWQGSLEATQTLADSGINAKKTLLFPPGKYIVSDTIMLNPNIVYKGYGATIVAKNFANKARFVAEGKTYTSDGNMVKGWTTTIIVNTGGWDTFHDMVFIQLDIIGLNFDGSSDGVFGGLAMTDYIYSKIADFSSRGLYAGIKICYSFNEIIDNVEGIGKYCGIAFYNGQEHRCSNIRTHGYADCTSSTDVANLDLAADWLGRDSQNSLYKNYGRALNVFYHDSIYLDSILVEGSWLGGCFIHCSANMTNLYSEHVCEEDKSVPGADATYFFGDNANLTIDSWIYKSHGDHFVFIGEASIIEAKKTCSYSQNLWNWKTNGVKGASSRFVYNPYYFNVTNLNTAIVSTIEIADVQTYSNIGNAETVKVTKYNSGMMVVQAFGFYSLNNNNDSLYQLIWTLPVPFVNSNYTVHGNKGDTGNYRADATATVSYIVDNANVVMNFSRNNVKYALTAIGFWK